ncbi:MULTISPECIES: DUF1826 domain-containing protein [unclassified Acinetobacter]|uniref:DUF1826 domain-containing protein n=1 Tax=unclassified Acinetobacter TaxID=196816 RepID=UPI0029350CAC|nr:MULTISPECIES: DUF1826 domain-containing protein [unclassified Acinetobacter]WOE32230.1 DUF1826 domain-containing protein [Acinetobacter sp. SAAs470]WOE37700.1 DUF1826 domain-containing protein [Acinetobacter sp. SAAs474]
MTDTCLYHQQFNIVDSFCKLVNTPFHGQMNAVCWHRNLVGDFKEIVTKLQLQENITEIFAEDLLALQLSEQGHQAREIILQDLQLLTDLGASPSLNLIKNYVRDEALDFISTDVYSYHVDRSPIEVDTFLCTYYGPASDILSSDQAQQKVVIPDIREKLQAPHHGSEPEFETFLKDNFFDLHYQPKPDSKPVNLGTGHLWRLAVDHPTQPVAPCIHRAPIDQEDDYRLLLIC